MSLWFLAPLSARIREIPARVARACRTAVVIGRVSGRRGNDALLLLTGHDASAFSRRDARTKRKITTVFFLRAAAFGRPRSRSPAGGPRCTRRAWRTECTPTRKQFGSSFTSTSSTFFRCAKMRILRTETSPPCLSRGGLAISQHGNGVVVGMVDQCFLLNGGQRADGEFISTGVHPRDVDKEEGLQPAPQGEG